MYDLQALMDGMSLRRQRERASSQITLGTMMDRLRGMALDAPVANLSNPHSYRGYYDDLAFESHEGTTTASDLLDLCQSCMGRVFEGYKGGDYMMGALTPVWVADYGSCGDKIVSIRDDGTIETRADEVME